MHTQTTLNEMTEMLPYILPAKQPMILLGMTGSGKTQYCKTVVREAYAKTVGLIADEIGFVSERVSNRDACELAGVALPMKDQDGKINTQYTKPPVISMIESTGREFGILLLDEVAQAAQDVQKVLADSFDKSEHSIGGWAIPAGWVVIGTGNRTQDKSGANRLLAHLTDRVLIFDVAEDVEGWAAWADDNGVHPLITGCARQYADQGFFADKVPSNYEQYNSFRSVTYASDHLTAYLNEWGQDADISRGVIFKLLEANIGKGAATMLANYSEVRENVPTEFAIQTDPEGCFVPDDTGYQMLAANNAIASASDAASADRAFMYILRLRTDLSVGQGIRLQKIMTAKNWVTNNPLVSQFNAKYCEVM
jgi:hypothetical protein